MLPTQHSINSKFHHLQQCFRNFITTTKERTSSNLTLDQDNVAQDLITALRDPDLYESLDEKQRFWCYATMRGLIDCYHGLSILTDDQNNLYRSSKTSSIILRSALLYTFVALNENHSQFIRMLQYRLHHSVFAAAEKFFQAVCHFEYKHPSTPTIDEINAQLWAALHQDQSSLTVDIRSPAESLNHFTDEDTFSFSFSEYIELLTKDVIHNTCMNKQHQLRTFSESEGLNNQLIFNKEINKISQKNQEHYFLEKRQEEVIHLKNLYEESFRNTQLKITELDQKLAQIESPGSISFIQHIFSLPIQILLREKHLAEQRKLDKERQDIRAHIKKLEVKLRTLNQQISATELSGEELMVYNNGFLDKMNRSYTDVLEQMRNLTHGRFQGLIAPALLKQFESLKTTAQQKIQQLLDQPDEFLINSSDESQEHDLFCLQYIRLTQQAHHQISEMRKNPEFGHIPKLIRFNQMTSVRYFEKDSIIPNAPQLKPSV